MELIAVLLTCRVDWRALPIQRHLRNIGVANAVSCRRQREQSSSCGNNTLHICLPWKCSALRAEDFWELHMRLSRIVRLLLGSTESTSFPRPSWNHHRVGSPDICRLAYPVAALHSALSFHIVEAVTRATDVEPRRCKAWKVEEEVACGLVCGSWLGSQRGNSQSAAIEAPVHFRWTRDARYGASYVVKVLCRSGSWRFAMPGRDENCAVSQQHAKAHRLQPIANAAVSPPFHCD